MSIESIKRRIHGICRLYSVYGLIFLLFSGCSAVKPPSTSPDHPKPYRIGRKWYKPLPKATGFSQRGKASWYGKKFHGRNTANGEIYNMYAMTAAHKTLPFDTHVRVRNLTNHRTVEVRINDRGPFARGRVIDLSYQAAKKIGMVGPGTADVEIVALRSIALTKPPDETDQSEVPVNFYEGNFTVQIGAFSELKNAERLKQQLDRSYENAHIAVFYDGYNTFYRVRVGRCSTLAQANRYEAYMIQNGFTGAFAIAEDK